MAHRILITGATGTLGARVVPAAAAAGHTVRALSRRDRGDDGTVRWHRGDLLAGTGLDAACDGVDTVVHCATQPTGDKDVTSMRNLIAAARVAGVGHLIGVSIVGIDRIPLPYYRTKLRVEEVLASSGLGHTVQRATQFHELVTTTFAVQRFFPVVAALRGMSFQPIDTRDVAARLVELVDAGPAGRAPDIGGPAVHTHAELARMYLNARGSRRPVVPIALPGRIVAGYKSGAHCVPDHAVGTISYVEFLAESQ